MVDQVWIDVLDKRKFLCVRSYILTYFNRFPRRSNQLVWPKKSCIDIGFQSMMKFTMFPNIALYMHNKQGTLGLTAETMQSTTWEREKKVPSFTYERAQHRGQTWIPCLAALFYLQPWRVLIRSYFRPHYPTELFLETVPRECHPHCIMFKQGWHQRGRQGPIVSPVGEP